MDVLRIGTQDYPTLSIPSEKSDSDTIHFTGANGFPVGTYSSFLNQFTEDYAITAADCRGAFQKRNTPPSRFGFSGFADDLVKVIEATHSEPVIAMGHSFGGHISLLAAIKRPDLIKKLVLIEPASLPNRWLNFIYPKTPKWLLNHFMPMIERTQNRQRLWTSRESFIAKYSDHATFKHFTEQAMLEYAEHGLFERKDGQYELVFDPDWEAYIFRNVEFIWNNLKRSNTPTLFLKAEHSSLYSRETFQSQNAKLDKHFSGIEIEDTHHLLPFENPKVCVNAVNAWLTRNQ